MEKRGQVDINSTMVMSMGIGMIITDVLSHGFNKGHPIAFPDSLSGGDAIVQVGLISILPGQVYAFGVGVVAVSAFFWLLYKTKMGRAFRAIAEDPSGARLVGIPLLKTGLESYALSGLLGGLIALLLASLIGSASSALGEQVAIKVIAVSIIAGLGNLVGGLVVAPTTLLWMAFKTGVHGHGAADFTAPQIIWVIKSTPGWILVGGLLGWGWPKLGTRRLGQDHHFGE